MKNMKKLTVILLTAALLVSAVPMAAADGTELPFEDIHPQAYYVRALIWAVENGITVGTGPTTFSPDRTCTRAQVVTFLWRANGSPEPMSSENPFADVRTGQYYSDAVLWAVENGITSGTGPTMFSPDADCTRAQVVTFLWRANGSPEPISSENPFTDVTAGQYYSDAVLWAVENGITVGTGPTTFSPDKTCNRAQIVTFLFRNNEPIDLDALVEYGLAYAETLGYTVDRSLTPQNAGYFPGYTSNMKYFPDEISMQFLREQVIGGIDVTTEWLIALGADPYGVAHCNIYASYDVDYCGEYYIIFLYG